MVRSASTSAFYFNGLLENYQQKVHSTFHDNPLRSAHGCRHRIPFHFSFNRHGLLNGMFNGSVREHETSIGHNSEYYNTCNSLQNMPPCKTDGTSVAKLRVKSRNPFPRRTIVLLGKGKSHSFIWERGKTMLQKFGKGLLTLLFSAAVLLFGSTVVFAAEALPAGGESYTKVMFAVGAMIAAGFAIGVGAVGAALGIGKVGSSACEAVGRNPGVQGKIMMTMLVGMAMAESIAIYALVVSLVLLYANPYMKYFLAG